MPQLDKLSFAVQIFWLVILFFCLFYFIVRYSLFQIKFVLGLRRFFIQGENIDYAYNHYLLKEKGSRSEFLYNFYFNNFLDQKKDINSSSSSLSYIFSLSLNKNYYDFTFASSFSKEAAVTFDQLNSFGKSVVYFYEKFTKVFNFFFSYVQFFILDSFFLLFYYFFNIFFSYRNSLVFLKLLNKVSV